MANDNETDVGVWVEDRLAALTPPTGWRADAVTGRVRLERGRELRAARMRSVLWSGAVAAVALCTIAFPATRVFAKRCVDVCVAETSLVIRGATPSTIVGDRRPAPDFVLFDASGHSVKLSALRGQVVLLNFWATWCPPCNEEVPWFVELQSRHPAPGLAVLGVSMDDDGWKSVAPWVAARNINYTMVLGSRQVAQSYGGVESLPSTFLIDKEGRIARSYIGKVDRRTYESEVMALLAENEKETPHQ
jgi:peroxiredoxin